ncbi:MAG: multicopper oxidase domain-containing protein [Pseudomonadota bacterium]|nr:multicopper oxidase domain-containing protein [Pseudomonadota bacterium]
MSVIILTVSTRCTKVRNSSLHWLLSLIIAATQIFVTQAFASEHTINLVVAYKTVNFAGAYRNALAVNNQIPAPTLHFKEGDHVTINVCNHLNEPTAIHWHGILIPWQMDGVEGISQKAIPPGGVFHYQFTLHQAGTYWYHAHAGLQEQQGLYGAFLIDPLKPHFKYTKDYVVVLSDWSNTNPDKILANLKKEGDYYSPKFPLQPSLTKFFYDYRKASLAERKKILDDYKMMQQMRMSIYDISDVAYDTFLLNGHSLSCPWTAPVTVGDVVRLRFIGAGGSTIFHVKIPGIMMQMVHAQGNDVKPYPIKDFTIAPGETYDVLVKIQHNNPSIIYAESMDTVGAAYGALVTIPHLCVNYKRVAPFPEPLPVTREMMSTMMGKLNQGLLPRHTSSKMSAKHSGHSGMSVGMGMGKNMKMNEFSDMEMPMEPTILGDTLSTPDSSYQTSIETKYQNMIAAVRTNDPNAPVAGVIKMELFGYMERFIWFINGVPEYKAHPIIFEPGKRYRFVFTNASMMHHPMHIHGHWFILRKGNDAFDPLLHTIDVPPGATITADVDTDTSGQWFFHCHLLYHMMTGMSRVLQYSTLIDITNGKAKPPSIAKQTSYLNRPIVRVDAVSPIDFSLVKHPMAHPVGLYFASFVDIGADLFNNVQRFTYKGLFGQDYNKLELLVEDAEIKKGKIENADVDIFYWRLISQFWAVKGGVNYFYRPAESGYWQPGIGIEGVMPYFIDTDVRAYLHNGSVKLDMDLSRDTQITNKFFVRVGVRSILASKTVTQDEIGSGFNQIRYIFRPYYRLLPGLNAFTEFEHEQDYGVLKNIHRNQGDSTNENTVTFGLSVVL